MTKVWRWLGRHLVGRQAFAAEFRADRMDAGWQSEYLELGGGDRPTTSRVPRLLHR